jgi:Protein of unknown function (DUF2786)
MARISWMNDMDNEIIDRIRKLTNMANDASSPAEAAIAAQRVRALLDKYCLDSADLERMLKEESTPMSSEQVDKKYKFMPAWKVMLIVAVGRFNDCQVVREKRKLSKTQDFMYQGFAVDVISAKNVYEYLSKYVEKECKKFMDEISPGLYLAKPGNAFKFQCSSTICEILNKKAKERESLHKNASSDRSLVLRKMDQVRANFEKIPEEKIDLNLSSDPEELSVAVAMMKGQEAGLRVNLNDQLTKPNTEATLLLS